MFQLVFKGECAPGTDPETARANARNLFKASVEQVERMFSGQPVVIRNKLEEVQAEKYRAVLKKHGMIAYVQPMAGAPEPARPVPAAAPESARQRSAEPAGTEMPSSSPATRKVPDTEPGERLSVAGDKVDDILSGSGLSLDPVGVTLVEHTEVEPPMFQHLEDWTLAPAGTELGVERELPPPVVPDVSHLSLVDEDASDKPIHGA
ncbi:hypothetical protein MYE70_15345 [Marinobacter alexandrii]|uniref:hypothetical protein n=1 Tax=Marinobacter alexandrii TaxID=2570351 RepID=UPI001FFEE88C|nr:hypothetical protein [Marinobacter alexandrii]MCK2150435.1 hypothetical protein [Marinobacter alexandrii]